MRTRTALPAAIAAGLLLTLTSCGQSYEETVAHCAQALKDRPEGDKGKPEECEEVKEDDYTAMVANQAIDDLGWTDEDGNFDKNKMLEDTLEHQP